MEYFISVSFIICEELIRNHCSDMRFIYQIRPTRYMSLSPLINSNQVLLVKCCKKNYSLYTSITFYFSELNTTNTKLADPKFK